MSLEYFWCSHLSWAESLIALLPFLCVALINLINDKLIQLNNKPIEATGTVTTTAKATDIEKDTDSIYAEIEIKQSINSQTKLNNNNDNNNIKKQKSEECENTPSASSSASPSPPPSARNSVNAENGISPSSSDNSYTDEYNEDEDTLSLENLFPCDQSEIYESKKINFIIDELIQTEANYVNNLRKGLQNYGSLQTRHDLPDTLRGEDKQQKLLGNIADIAKLHEEQILPLMLRNRRDLKQLFNDFSAYFDKNEFYVYVKFTMNKKDSMQLRQDHRAWLWNYQTEVQDKLGIDSFLVQPIQRLTRYPLLLQQFISEFYKSSISCKPVLMAVCKLETRMRRLLEVVNQSEEVMTIEELNDFDLQAQSNFRKTTEFDVYHYKSRKKYRAKILLFDRCLLCAEVRKRRLAFRHFYPWETIDLQLSNAKTIAILSKNSSGHLKEEMDLTAPEGISIKHWLQFALKTGEVARLEAAKAGKFTLPMDLVMGVVFAIWLIWLYF